LSKSDNAKINPEEGLPFYYNREHRLDKASQAVRDLYKVQKFNRFNLLQPLIGDKPRAMIFFFIILLCGIIIIFSILGYFDKSFKLEGNKLEISGTVFEGTTIITLRKTITGKLQVYTGAVDIGVSEPAETDEYSVFYHRIFFTFEPEEGYRFAVPFDSPELLIVLQTEKTSLKIKIESEQF
jgi:hypothetical protein